MRLTAYSNFALRILMYCALRGDSLSRVEDIARSFGISKAHLVKAAHQLGQLGYLENVRGRNGGVRLQQPPARITVGDVIRHTEGSMALVECFDPGSNTCPLAAVCRLRSALFEARNAFLEVLDGVSIADLTANDAELLSLLRVPGVETSSS